MEQALTLMSSLAIGLLLGLDRERSPGTKAGLRTFALVALLGTLSAWLAQEFDQGLIIAAGLLAVGAMMVSAYHATPDDPGTTTTAALLLCYGLGAMIGAGETYAATVIALVAALLLHFKAELHGFTGKLSEEDLRSILQFAVIAFAILPILPDQGYGPYGALNPYRIWWMVVLVCGLSLAAYAALRVAGHRLGVPLVAALGGAISSTGTTLVISRQLRRGTVGADIGAVIILGSNLVVLLRLSVIAAVVAPGVLMQLLPVFAAGALTGAWALLLRWRGIRRGAKRPTLELSNPTELGLALGSGAMFAGVLLAAAWLHDHAGTGAVYSMAAIMGLPDLDAVTLSILRLFQVHQLDVRQVVTAVLIAYLSNMACKLVLVAIVGGRGALGVVARGYAATAVGLVAAWALRVA